VREVVAKRDARRGGFDEFAGARAIEHAGLSSHDGLSFYTGGEGKAVESRKLKVEGGQSEKITQRRREHRVARRVCEEIHGRGKRERKKGQPAAAGCPTGYKR
jgi:hypothetical protein